MGASESAEAMDGQPQNSKPPSGPAVHERPAGGLMSYKQLVEATENFANIVGRGGSSIVYRGTLPGGIVTAVKMLTLVENDEREFLQEMNILTKLKHPNVVRFVGYAVHERLYILNEFAENGSLADWIKKIQAGQFQGKISIDWRKRIQIATDTCKGLMHLHAQTPAIFHFDLKPANILLDRRMAPLITDFGLSRSMPELEKRAHTMLQPKGTPGYICPDFLRTGHANERTDVFSLGVILLQLLTALPPTGRPNEPSQVEWCTRGHSLWEARDPTAGDWPEPVFTAVQTLARRMCCSKSRERPPLDEVLVELERAAALQPRR